MISFGYLQIALLLTMLSSLLGCTEQQDAPRTTPDTFKVALLPDQNKDAVIDRHKLLFKHLQEEVGKNFELIVPSDYAATLNLFVEKKVDIAYFGGVTFVKAGQQVNAKPLVSRDIDGKFTSVVLINSKVDAKQLEDIKGKSFSFGSKLSTSGHLMPRYFFEQRNIIPESFFSKIIYSGAHDRTAMMVSQGEVDAGVVNASIVKTMFEDGRLQRSNVIVLWRSPQYQDYVWAIQPEIENRIRNKIRDSFLALNRNNETGRQILSDLEANYFIPVSHSDYEVLKSILNKQTTSNQ